MIDYKAIAAAGGIAKPSGKGAKSEALEGPTIDLKSKGKVIGQGKKKKPPPKDPAKYVICEWCGETFRETEVTQHHITSRGSAGSAGDIEENLITVCGPNALWGCHLEAQQNIIPKEALYRRKAALMGIGYEEIISRLTKILGRRPDVP